MTRAALAAALGGRLPPRGARIGLLGGSFNPAHAGHLQLSLEALKRLGLDEVWWLISPQNPLKTSRGMAPLAERLAGTRRFTRHPRLRPCIVESLLDTRYTADTVSALKRLFPGVRFVWLIGADNLKQLESWKRWPQILNGVPVAVFDRPAYSVGATAAKAARRFAHRRLPERGSRCLAGLPAPVWTFLRQPLNAESATEIRARRAARS